MASSLPETLNVSRFFNRKDFSNTVEIIVNDTKFICSGVVLAHQSPVFEKLFSTGASFVLLQDFFYSGSEIFVEECLNLLYGGKILVTLQNIEALTRFSLIYDVKFMYELAIGWIRDNITYLNVFELFNIGNLPEVKSRKQDVYNHCLEIMKRCDVEVSQEMSSRLKSGKVVAGDFIRDMIRMTNCPALMGFLVNFCGQSEQNTNFVLDLRENVDFENLFLDQKELFNSLMCSMKKHTESPFRLKQLLEIQMEVLKL
ncbi:hypothetical protein ACHWQZ_G009450 [Mnemiopsis leidyi]